MANGLHGKYIILKASTGKPVNHPCFVLRVDGSDPAATRAIEAYALATSNMELKDDLLRLAERLGGCGSDG
jgi:hypothetical protein